jgi:hypothetical protein
MRHPVLGMSVSTRRGKRNRECKNRSNLYVYRLCNAVENILERESRYTGCNFYRILVAFDESIFVIIGIYTR